MSAAPAHDTVMIAAARGDDEALTTLVRLYHRRVYRFGLRVCRDGFDADDAVQEAFVKLAARPDVVAAPSALSWLFTVVRNTCRRMLRPLRRQHPTLAHWAHDADEGADSAAALPSTSPEAARERWELVAAVHAAIARLTPDHRAVLVLRDLEGLTGEQTCAALCIDAAAMKSRLHRARAALRADLHDRVALAP